MKSVDLLLKSRFKNNFDFLRLFGAFLVIFSHSYALTTGPTNNELFYSLTGSNVLSFGALGVTIFFVISGFLVTFSWLKRPIISGFFWNRILRIVPGLFVAATLTIFIIGPLVTILPLKEYFNNPITFGYYKIILIYFPNQYLPGVFVNNIFPNVVNGSLWIIAALFTMYTILFLMGILRILSKKRIVLFITFFLALAYICNTTSYFVFTKPFFGLIYYNKFAEVTLLNSSPAAVFFMIGVLYYLYKDFIKYDIKVAILFVLLLVLSLNTPLLMVISFITLPYIILCIAFAPIPFLNNAGKYGDFSYGLYIFAFPIQQTLYYFINSITIMEMFLISSLFVIPISVLFNKFVESKALKLKSVKINKLLNNILK